MGLPMLFGQILIFAKILFSVNGDWGRFSNTGDWRVTGVRYRLESQADAPKNGH